MDRGDRVICTFDMGLFGKIIGITQGNIYKIEAVVTSQRSLKDEIYIYDDNGKFESYDLENFSEVSVYRESVINEILE